MSRLKLRHFSSHHGLLLGNFVVVFGRHGGEKTSLLRDLAASLAPKIDGAVAVGLEGLAPSNCTFASLETSLLDRLAETPKAHQILFFVDAVVDRKVLASDSFRRLLTRRGLTTILALPTSGMLPAHLRPFVDFVFQFAEPQIAVRKALFTHFAAGFTKDFDDLSRIVDKATDGFDSLVISLKSRSTYLDQIFFWYHVDDLERAPAVSLPPFFPPDDDDDDEDYRIIDISSSRKKDETAPDPTQVRRPLPLADWLHQNFDIYEGDVLVDFTDGTGKFVRAKVSDWFVPFKTVHSRSKADGRSGSESDLGRELTKAGWHEWIVNLKNDEGKRRTTRTRVGLRRRTT